MNARVEQIFHEVADLSATGRAEYFRRHAIDQATRNEVAALLEFDSDSSDTPFEKDIAELAQRALAGFERTGMRCGPYRLERLLGSGGMGSVYSAERVDGEVSQRVAVKLLQPGANTGRLGERFLAERQILANLSHPNIARLLDAGRSEDGQPYLVMDYIAGQPIDVYTAEFSVGSKVRLFLKVCAAVGYLHRNLVVHRDLKPANILVTAYGEPKLLDFGIAKMLDLISNPAASSIPMLTPDYASPEQMVGGATNTATDVYSLGAVLYKLLTGISPHRFEKEPAHEVVSALSSARITPPGRLVPAVKRDLDIIVLKALRKEPQERYSSVEQLAEDLESYLKLLPIRARRGDTWYQVRKFLRRRGLPVAAAALAMAGLSAGLLVANRERAIAQQRFMQVRQLANQFIEMHDDVAKLPGSTKIREKMVTTALDYLHNLARSSGDDPKLLGEIGEVYEKVAKAQGVPGQANLGRWEDALSSLRKAIEFEDRAAKLDGAYRTQLSLFRNEFSYLALVNGRFAEARQNLDAAAETLDQLLSERPEDAELMQLAGRIAGTRGDLSEMEGKLDQELSFFEEAERLNYEYLRRKPSNEARLHAYRATTLKSWALADNKRYGEALAALNGSAALIDSLLAAEPENPSYLRQKMAGANYEGEIYDNETGNCLGKPLEAAAAFLKYVEIARKLVAADPNNASARLSLASAYYKMSWPLGKINAGQSVRVAKDSVQLFDEELAHNPHDRFLMAGHARALRHLAYAQQRSNNRAEARAALKEAIATEEQVVTESPMDKHEGDQLVTSRKALENLEAADSATHGASK